MYNNSTSYAIQAKAVSVEKKMASEINLDEELEKAIDKTLKEYRRKINGEAFKESKETYDLLYAAAAERCRKEEENTNNKITDLF